MAHRNVLHVRTIRGNCRTPTRFSGHTECDSLPHFVKKFHLKRHASMMSFVVMTWHRVLSGRDACSNSYPDQGSGIRMLVKIDHLEKAYGSGEDRQPVLRGISLQIDRGESLAITGESGSGKSTLLHLIGLLDAPDAGTIQIDGERVSDLDDKGRAARRRSQIGLVFQQFNLIPSLTVRQNIALQARLAKRLDEGWVETLTERLGLTTFLDRFPEQLSGGQQQRVAVARALATRPALLLADEPTGNLDEETSAQVLALMLELCADDETALIMVTHSMAAAEQLSRRVHLTGGRLS